MVKECREYIWEEDMLGNKCNGCPTIPAGHMVTDRYRTSIPLAQKEEYERFADTFIPKAWRRNWLEKRSTAFTGEMPQESDIYVRTASKDLMMSSARYFPTLVYRYAPTHT